MSEEKTVGGVQEFSTTAKKFNGEAIEAAREFSASYDFGQSVEEAIENFGADVVFNAFITATKVDIQAMLRRKMETGKKVEGAEVPVPYTDEELQEAVAEYKPGVKSRGDGNAALLKKLAGFTPEQLAALIAKAKGE